MKTLSDPEEFARIREMYILPRFVSDEPNEELMDRELARQRLTVNQAR